MTDVVLIFKASDLRGVDPEIAARLIEPSFDPDRDLTITIRRETDPDFGPAVDMRKRAPLSTPADCRSAAEDLFA